MKTGEMIKELTENPEKKFKSIHEDKSIAPTFAVTGGGGGGILFENFLGEPTPLYYIGFDWKWEEVKEPLTFNEVLEKVIEDDSIKIKVEGEGFMDLGTLLNYLKREFFNEDIALILKTGKFYIKD